MLKGMRHVILAAHRGLAVPTNFAANAPIYLDVQATSPMVCLMFDSSYCVFALSFRRHVYFQDPRVVDAMIPFMTENFGNPHSRTHAYG